MTSIVLDLLLCSLIVAAALSAVFVRDLFAAIVFFIVYGLLIAIAWVRLDAVDVALAEAAIGAGLTGLLLVGAAARLKVDNAERREALPHGRRTRLIASMQFALCIGGSLALLLMLLPVAQDASAPRPPVTEHLTAAGVSNPVTAVLLNFRAYDTLLEAVVLVLALVGVWSLTPDRFWGGIPGVRQHARPEGVLAYFGRLLPAIGLLMSIHLLWAGTSAPGGAFQAGTVLAAVWLITVMAGLVEVPAIGDLRVRTLLVFGPLYFVLVAILGIMVGGFLRYPVGLAEDMILSVELVLAVSIATALGLLVLGVPRRLP